MVMKWPHQTPSLNWHSKWDCCSWRYSLEWNVVQYSNAPKAIVGWQKNTRARYSSRNYCLARKYCAHVMLKILGMLYVWAVKVLISSPVWEVVNSLSAKLPSLCWSTNGLRVCMRQAAAYAAFYACLQFRMNLLRRLAWANCCHTLKSETNCFILFFF